MFQLESNNIYPHVSVDCVVFGFDGIELKVLLIERDLKILGIENDMKLPGSPIYSHEDVDEAATRILTELTGLKNIYLRQFKTFSSLSRVNKTKDLQWLEHTTNRKYDRIITVAYLSLIKINTQLNKLSLQFNAKWCSLNSVDNLAFDHNKIIKEAICEVRKEVEIDPSLLFELLPRKFVAAQLRKLYEVIFNRVFDVRNFHKKITSMKYVIALDEVQKSVPHRSARFYRFNKIAYNKQKLR